MILRSFYIIISHILSFGRVIVSHVNLEPGYFQDNTKKKSKKHAEFEVQSILEFLRVHEYGLLWLTDKTM